VQGDLHFTADQIECAGEDERGQALQSRPIESTGPKPRGPAKEPSRPAVPISSPALDAPGGATWCCVRVIDCGCSFPSRRILTPDIPGKGVRINFLAATRGGLELRDAATTAHHGARRCVSPS
jgi:hypothetical protein